MDASCVKEKPEGEAAVRTGEAEPGPAEAAPGERSAVERLILTERDWFSPGAVPGRVAKKRVRPGPFHWRPASPVRTAPFLSLFCYIKR